MIKAKLSEVIAASRALQKINTEVRLQADLAWSVARMVRKMRDEVKAHEAAVRTVIRGAGGKMQGNGMLAIPSMEPRAGGETKESFDARVAQFQDTLEKVFSEIEILDAKEVEIDLATLKVVDFTDKRDIPEKERRVYSANDFADLGPFLEGPP